MTVQTSYWGFLFI